MKSSSTHTSLIFFSLSIYLSFTLLLSPTFIFVARIVQTFEGEIRQNLGALYRLAESLALLDLIVSHAILAFTTPRCVRPEFSFDGAIALKRARHPLREQMLQHEYIATDVLISPSRSIQIVSGSNMVFSFFLMLSLFEQLPYLLLLYFPF